METVWYSVFTALLDSTSYHSHPTSPPPATSITEVATHINHQYTIILDEYHAAASSALNHLLIHLILNHWDWIHHSRNVCGKGTGTGFSTSLIDNLPKVNSEGDYYELWIHPVMVITSCISYSPSHSSFPSANYDGHENTPHRYLIDCFCLDGWFSRCSCS